MPGSRRGGSGRPEPRVKSQSRSGWKRALRSPTRPACPRPSAPHPRRSSAPPRTEIPAAPPGRPWRSITAPGTPRCSLRPCPLVLLLLLGAEPTAARSRLLSGRCGADGVSSGLESIGPLSQTPICPATSHSGRILVLQTSRVLIRRAFCLDADV